jgi:60S ribosome subunit biogenesis protein NIP7
MRLLTDEETKVLFTKLYEYMGESLENLLRNRSPSVFRLIKNRVFYIDSALVSMASNVPK